MISSSEKRQRERRPLEMPIAFYANGAWDIKKYAIGWTRDVSIRGVCIRTSRDHMPEIDAPLVMVLIRENEDSDSGSATSVKIRGTVVWVNMETKRFGVNFS